MSNVEQELVSKWEQSGLLEQTVNKTSMAKLLEAAAVSLVKVSQMVSSDEQQQKAFVAIPVTTFPILQRAFRNANFNVDDSLPENNSFTVPVDLLSNFNPSNVEDWHIEVCKTSGQMMSERLSGLVNPVVTSVNVVPKMNGYDLVIGIA